MAMLPSSDKLGKVNVVSPVPLDCLLEAKTLDLNKTKDSEKIAITLLNKCNK